MTANQPRFGLVALLLVPAVVAAFSVAPGRVTVPARLVGYRTTSTVLASDTSSDDSSTEDWFNETEESLQKNVKDGIKCIDKNFLARAIRISNHAPTLISLAYFGLMSMVSQMPDMASNLSPTAAALTRRLGPVTNAEYSVMFPTQITPASWVFYAWPLISFVQLATVSYSALRPGRSLLSHGDLTSLSMANIAAAAWLIVASRTLETASPLGSALIIPLVPLISGFPLRNMRLSPTKRNWRNSIFQLYSSFTTIATFLGLTVELQHGGRIPFFGGRAELCSAIFLSAYTFLVRCPGQSLIKRYVNAIAMVGIVFKRLMDGLTVKNLVSVSFFGTCGVLYLAVKKALADQEDADQPDDINDIIDDIATSFSAASD